MRKLDTGSTRRQSKPTEDSEGAGIGELTPPSSSASATGGEGEDGDAPPPPVPIPQFKRAQVPRSVQEDTSTDATPVPTPDTSRPSTPSSHILTAKAGPGGKGSRRARKAAYASLQHSSAPVSSGDESPARSAKKKANMKGKRRWDDSGAAIEDDGEDSTLDYSGVAGGDEESSRREGGEEVEAVSAETMGSRTGKGEFVLKDLDDEVDAILASSSAKLSQQQQRHPTSISTTADPEATGTGLLGSATSKLSGLFRNVVGGKQLTKQDLQQPLQQMQNHLVAKNVAREAAERLCSSVEQDLLNQKTASFTSIDATISESMGRALTKILTPTSSLDLLREIQRVTSGTTSAGEKARPYVISIVGVNGVGKSTNLSKIAYFLLQNRLRVLVVAADTFRSGAVEQLRVHVRNLSELSRREDVGKVELFEKGYGKDAATVARDAVTFASNSAGGKDGQEGMLYDVVLIDTAGRRHNDSRLMSSLTKFGQLARPDKVFMVGEALVGTDSVAQARNFAKEFVDSKVSSSPSPTLSLSLSSSPPLTLPLHNTT